MRALALTTDYDYTVYNRRSETSLAGRVGSTYIMFDVSDITTSIARAIDTGAGRGVNGTFTIGLRFFEDSLDDYVCLPLLLNIDIT